MIRKVLDEAFVNVNALLSHIYRRISRQIIAGDDGVVAYVDILHRPHRNIIIHKRPLLFKILWRDVLGNASDLCIPTIHIQLISNFQVILAIN